MGATFVLPLYPLEGRVLLPGGSLPLPQGSVSSRLIVDHAKGFGGALIASLVDGDAVHEVAVTAFVTESTEGEAALHGITRCKLLDVVSEDVPLVRAHRLPEPRQDRPRNESVRHLLLRRYTRLRDTLGQKTEPPPEEKDLPALTWRITADLGFTAEQQQGLLCVPDSLTRGRLLLVAVRELEKRERFLRPFARFREGAPWN